MSKDPCRGASIVVDVVEETEKAGRPEALARNLPLLERLCTDSLISRS